MPTIKNILGFMKNFGFLFCFILISNYSFSQSLCQKGTWIVGSNFLNYSPFALVDNSGKEKTTVQTFSPDTTLTTSNSTSSSFNKGSDLYLTLTVGFGYFISDNLIFGGGINNFLPSSVFIRYYFGQKKHRFYHLKQDNARRFAFFGQAGLSATYNNKKYEEQPIQGLTLGANSKSSSYNINPKAGIGGTYLITKKIALETSFYYSYNIYGNKYDRDIKLSPSGSQRIIGESKTSSHSITILFGFQTYF